MEDENKKPPLPTTIEEWQAHNAKITKKNEYDSLLREIERSNPEPINTNPSEPVYQPNMKVEEYIAAIAKEQIQSNNRQIGDKLAEEMLDRESYILSKEELGKAVNYSPLPRFIVDAAEKDGEWDSAQRASEVEKGSDTAKIDMPQVTRVEVSPHVVEVRTGGNNDADPNLPKAG